MTVCLGVICAMTFRVKERVLHFIYQYITDVPDFIITICDAYEGPIKDRIGFNFPMSVVKRVDPKSTLLSYEADYFIGYQKRDIITKRHELQHAKYYMDPAFRREVKELWESFPASFQTRTTQRLLKMNYPNNPDILLDEFQAYYFTEKPNFFGK
jgi:hypothetical protein